MWGPPMGRFFMRLARFLGTADCGDEMLSSLPISKGGNAGLDIDPLEIRKATAVAMVEGDAAIRKGWMHILEDWPGYRAAGGYRNGDEALQMLPHNPPDFVLMDIDLPGLSGIECTRKLKRILPDIEILALTMFGVGEKDRIFQALKAGASGNFLKHVRPIVLKAAMDDIQSGGALMTPSIARLVVKHFKSTIPTRKAKRSSGMNCLSFEESEVMRLLSQGSQHSKIATDLHISLDAVHTSIRRTYQKLHRHSGIRHWS